MCLSPKYVTIRPKVYQLDGFQGSSYELPVPCGECAECLKQRQSQYRTRVLLNSQKFPYAYFVTLTYNDDSLPIFTRVFEIDRCTGEFLNASLYDENNTLTPCAFVLDRNLVYWKSVRQRLNDVKPNSYVRQFSEDVDLGNFGLFRYFYSDSLDYSDVKGFLKRLRSSLKYRLGDECPRLSYINCGEYGPRTHRPHFHLVMMFDKPIENFRKYVRECWNFGFVDVKQIGSTSQDFTKVGSYISKYIVKGKLNEEPAALDGFCVRPRVRSSIGFGSYLTDNQISYLRCWDLFGPYSMFDYKKVFDTDEKCNTLFQEMSKRFRCLFPSTSTPITKSLVVRLFSVRTPSGNRCWSPLYLAFRDFKRDIIIARDKEQYQQYCRDNGFTENTIDSFTSFERFKESLGRIAEAKFRRDSAQFYKRSKV